MCAHTKLLAPVSGFVEPDTGASSTVEHCVLMDAFGWIPLVVLRAMCFER